MKKRNQKFSVSTSNDPVKKTKQWVKKFVIELNLCPFAHRPYSRDIIRYSVVDFNDVDEFVLHFYSELQILDNAPPKDLSTTLIIVNKGLEDFDFYLDILETFEDVLRHSEFKDDLQLESFHPDYYFDDTDPDDVTNYTNRSPYPMIHIIRVTEMAEALESYNRPEEIPMRNKELMIKMGSVEILRRAHLAH